MKIYFGFTVVGDRSTLENARKIVEILESLGHEVLTKHLVRDDAREIDRLISPQEVYHRDMKWLQQCDLFIAEVSGTSFGVGYEAGYILGSMGKKAWLFYRKDLEKKVSLLITGNTHPNCVSFGYSGINEIEAFIRTHLNETHR